MRERERHLAIWRFGDLAVDSTAAVHLQSPHRHSATSPNSHRGFTLIEMMVVIGIIVMLVGLTIAVGTSIHAKAEVSQTEHMLTTLDQALREWELTAERQISYGTNGDPPGSNAVYD